MGAGKSHHVVIDEVEEDIYVLLFDDGMKLHLKENMLPPGVREGTVLKVTLEIDEVEQKRRIAEIADIQQRLLKRTRGE
ncbi:MAG: DUF3006 domain-containing protein [Candidatus Hydrogenedentota bacterium]